MLRKLMGKLAINTKNEAGNTALIIAADTGDLAIVTTLLAKRGIDSNATNKDGESALIRAAYKGHDTVVNVLLPKCRIEDILQREHNHHLTAAQVAEKAGHRDIADLILAREQVLRAELPNAPQNNNFLPPEEKASNGAILSSLASANKYRLTAAEISAPTDAEKKKADLQNSWRLFLKAYVLGDYEQTFSLLNIYPPEHTRHKVMLASLKSLSCTESENFLIRLAISISEIPPSSQKDSFGENRSAAIKNLTQMVSLAYKNPTPELASALEQRYEDFLVFDKVAQAAMKGANKYSNLFREPIKINKISPENGPNTELVETIKAFKLKINEPRFCS
jgi:hypothetical protein